jgi:hypothetical protein
MCIVCETLPYRTLVRNAKLHSAAIITHAAQALQSWYFGEYSSSSLDHCNMKITQAIFCFYSMQGKLC